MNEKELDKMLKQEIQKDKQIPEKINQLFYNFEKGEVMKKEENKKSKNNLIKFISIAACLLVVLVVSGSTYAHVNGKENWLSPLLKNLGINSKYEEHATNINEEVKNNNVNVKMLDAAIDDSTLIVGYQINIENINMDNWIEIQGEYKINDINISPINKTIDKEEDNSFIIYQVFDMNEIDLKNSKEAKFESKMSGIIEYAEYEDINSADKEYINTYNGNWAFNKTLPINNVEENKEYEFKENNTFKTNEIEVTVDGYIKSSYTNILKISTNKSNYKGDEFEYYYKILNYNNKELARGKETREYDYRKYVDRLVISSIPKDNKITIEMYMRKNNNEFQKVGSATVDCSKAKEKVKLPDNYTKYDGEKYSFYYNKSWKKPSIITSEKAGPYSKYLGALEVEIPSTTNSKETSSISILKTNKKYNSLDKYVKNMKKEYAEEDSGISEFKSENNCKIGSLEGKKLVYEISDGETVYVTYIYVVEKDGNIYEIDFNGSEKECNNLKEEIELFIQSFEIK